MSVGDSFTVTERFQHCRVAASEYSRRFNVVFTCRKQDDDTMIVYRVANDQKPVDQRGRHGRRKIVTVSEPTAMQFDQWLASFEPGQSYVMPETYSHLFAAIIAWCELHSIKRQRSITASLIGGKLLITRLI
jgi:hypothetical protein